MKLLIELDEEYVKVIDKIEFLVGGRTNRKLQLEIIKAIKNGKVLEQEPRKGYWIDDEFGSKCSYCGIHTHLDKFDRPMKFKYCSMCGAKMVEPQESEDNK